MSIVLFTLVLSGCSWQEMFQEEKTKLIDKEIAQQEELRGSDISETYEGISTADWQMYLNNVHGYTLKYPQDWSKQGSDEMINFHNNSGADVTIYKSGVSRGEQIEETLDEHMTRLYDHYMDLAENDDAHAEIYARQYDVNNYESGEINGYPVYKLAKPISMDSSKASLFVKVGASVLAIEYTELDATRGDAFLEEDLPITYKILSTLTVAE